MGLFSGSDIRKTMKKKIEGYNPEFSFMGFFRQGGLPIPNEVLLGIMLRKDEVLIVDEKHEFAIKTHQIEKVKCGVERETEKEMKTSAAKGIAGGLLFGVAGAVVGSQAKQKTVSDVIESTLSIIYNGSNGDKRSIKLAYRTIGDSIPHKMKEFEARINEIVSSYRIPESGRIEL